MNWTKEKPTQPGWYFITPGTFKGTPVPRLIVEKRGELVIEINNGVYSIPVADWEKT